MNNILHDIWRGNINLQEERMASESTYKKKEELIKHAEELKQRLAVNLSQEETNPLLLYDREMAALAKRSEEEGFIKGCVFVGNIMIAVL